MPETVQWRIEYRAKGAAPSVYLLDDKPFLVGRHEHCNLILSSVEVSRKHCRFTIQQGDLYVEDLGSTNGTFVNGGRVSGTMRLLPGDLLMVGTAELQVHQGAAAEQEMLTMVPPDNPKDAFAEAWGLSRREMEVVFLLLKGKSSQDIADRLFISPGTVKNHISNIYRKTETKSRLQLANLYDTSTPDNE